MSELAELRAKYERLQLLHQVGNVIHSTLDPQTALQLITDQAVKLVNASSGSIVLINPTTQFLEILAGHGLPKGAAALRLRVGEGMTGWVARTDQALLCTDVRQDPRYIMVREEVRSELAVPLRVNGEIRGVLNVDSDRVGAFTAEDQKLLEDLAAQASAVIHNTWIYEQLRLKAQLFESLASVSQAINSTLSLDETLNVITREACQLMRARMCSLMLLDETREWLDLRASYGAGEAYLRKPRLSASESLVGSVVRRRKPKQVDNVQSSALYQNVEVARTEGLVGLLSVPLLFRDEAIGALNVYTSHPYAFSNEEVRILSALAQLSAVAIQKARLYERVVDVEEQLRKNEKLSVLGLLAAEVAHEIRNPLTVMKMLYHSLDLSFPDGDPRNKDVRILGEKMDHLNKIVEQVLDFARSAEPHFTLVHLRALLDELRLLVRHKLKQQNVQWVQQVPADLPPLVGDATQLEQAFLNVILNAAEAMPAGGTLEISAKPAPPGADAPHPTHLLVEFRDTGQGMDAEQQRRVFGSMLNSSKATGTGLGLAIVRRVVEAHQGTLSIRSEPGKGASISLLFPLGEAPPA
jgi:signal transduction histidine kinase